MDYVLSKKYNETFTINFIGTEKLTYSTGETSENRLHLTIDEPITGVNKISGITYRVDGVIDDTQYLKLYFKFKNAGPNDLIPCDACWSNMLPIEMLSGLTLNPNQPFDFELFVYRVDDPIDNNPPTDIWISNIVISGFYSIDKTDSIIDITNDNNQIILEPADIYKVFSASDFQVISFGNTGNVDIKFRVTYDNGRSYTDWENLTKSNISTHRFNELRFAKMQYLITQIYESDIPTRIYDIILIGDFQNVSANYLKTNRYGLREDCLTSLYNGSGSGTGVDFSCGYPVYSTSTSLTSSSSSNSPGYDLKMNFYTQGLSCYIHTTTTNEINIENQSNSDEMWNPYETNKITELYNKLANDVSNIFSWKVDYHLTDPDENGTDMVFHEYQLYNIINIKNIRVLVPDNKFPDNTVKMNKFNLDLFDTFEIHILKDEFKNHFGIDNRPAENDIIFFCELNRLYYVKHAQVFREIMNTGIYWRVILGKYEQKANIRNLSEESKIKLDKLTKNTTLDELFGAEESDEQEKIANKEQTKPITHELMRNTIYKDVIIAREKLYNGNIDFAQYYYNFKDVAGKRVIIYKKTDQNLKDSDNRSFIMWFNFNNSFSSSESYYNTYDVPSKDSTISYSINAKKNFNFLNNFDESINEGYRIWYHKDKIYYQLNENYYALDVDIKTNIWYGLVINHEQRNNKLDMYLYTRPGGYDIKMINPSSYELATVNYLDTTGITYLTTIGFKPIDNIEIHSISTDFVKLYEKSYPATEGAEIGYAYSDSFTHEKEIEIIGSNIKYTNLRIFKDVIPVNSINDILNQSIIIDEHKLILSDNANRRLYTDNQPTKRWV
jgi:hypothetical protein